jgi:hypothetical protein
MQHAQNRARINYSIQMLTGVWLGDREEGIVDETLGSFL